MRAVKIITSRVNPNPASIAPLNRTCTIAQSLNPSCRQTPHRPPGSQDSAKHQCGLGGPVSISDPLDVRQQVWVLWCRHSTRSPPELTSGWCGRVKARSIDVWIDVLPAHGRRQRFTRTRWSYAERRSDLPNDRRLESTKDSSRTRRARANGTSRLWYRALTQTRSHALASSPCDIRPSKPCPLRN